MESQAKIMFLEEIIITWRVIQWENRACLTLRNHYMLSLRVQAALLLYQVSAALHLKLPTSRWILQKLPTRLTLTLVVGLDISWHQAYLGQSVDVKRTELGQYQRTTAHVSYFVIIVCLRNGGNYWKTEIVDSLSSSDDLNNWYERGRLQNIAKCTKYANCTVLFSSFWDECPCPPHLRLFYLPKTFLLSITWAIWIKRATDGVTDRYGLIKTQIWTTRGE